jgi:hypothetical protein
LKIWNMPCAVPSGEHLLGAAARRAQLDTRVWPPPAR